jgi:hypothetical protein
MNTVKIGGRYRHYKGNEYTVIGIAKHSETLEETVIYRAMYGDGQLWARPLSMFVETVTVNGQEIPRFSLLEN